MDSKSADPSGTREAQVVGELEAVSERTSTVARVETTVYSGPLPPPSILAQYNTVLPDGAERIMRMIEVQSQHRQGLESYALRGEHHRSILGMLLGAIVVFAMLILARYAINQQQQAAAMILGSLPIVGIAGVFVYGTNSRRYERVKKAEQAKSK